MLEVGVTAPQPPGALHHCETDKVACEMNATEWKTHFSAWCITSAPLVLGMDLRDKVALDKAWPIISNRAVLEVQATWVGDSGRLWARSEETTEVPNCGHGKGCQLPLWLVWTKKQPATGGGSSAAILLMNNGDATLNVSAALDGINGLGSCGPSGCATRDLWVVDGGEQARIRGELVRTLQPHDSAMLIVTSDNPAPPPTPGALRGNHPEAAQCDLKNKDGPETGVVFVDDPKAKALFKDDASYNLATSERTGAASSLGQLLVLGSCSITAS